MHDVCLNNYLSFNFKIKLGEENAVKLHELPLPPPLSLTIENHKCFTISHFMEKTHTLKVMPEFVLKSTSNGISVIQVSFLHNLLLTFPSENLAFITLSKEREISFRRI